MKPPRPSPVEEKICYNYGPDNPSNGSVGFKFHRGGGTHRSSRHNNRSALGKPTPSKWDDAQKWLVGISRGRGDSNKNLSKPRNSNADDRRLIPPVPQEHDYSSDEVGIDVPGNQGETETEKVECVHSVWRVNKPSAVVAVRSICVRDMGTEMTPIASQEPSRTGTPIRATTPIARSPVDSGSTTPVRGLEGALVGDGYRTGVDDIQGGARVPSNRNVIGDGARKVNPLESQAMAWDEAERAKHMARYKREEVKIQAWENHQKRKAEMKMKKMEVKAERLKARAQEKLTNKIAATRRIAEEKRANAGAKLNEKAVRTSERADYIRRTGHFPSSFSFKLPSFCW